MLIPRGNSKATVYIASHMFLLCVGKSHKGKREIALCLGDIKHVDLCNQVYKPREHSLEKNRGSKATMLANYLIN